MLTILNVVAPVFLLIALGYTAVRLKLFPRSGIAGLIGFVHTFAVPCLLFRAMLTVDFAAAFNPAIIGPFYFAATCMMVFGYCIARGAFKRRPGEAVAVGFAAMFSNTVMMGIPILQRAYGEEGMPIVYSIIGLHAPVLVTAAMLFMELMRRDGGKISTALAGGMVKSLKNPILVGVGLGLAGNLAGIELSGVPEEVTLMLASTVMPVALFGLGGALNDYKLADNWGEAAVMSALKLLAQPLIAWVIMVPILGVPLEMARYGIVLAAMPAGINVYIFATYYNRATNVAANSILISTAFSIITISIWLLVFGA